jgi:Domain of unknown function (DUF4253)
MSNQNGALERAIREIGSDPDTLIPLRSTDRGDVLSFPIETERALDVWKVFRERVEETGYWPVIVDSGFCEELREAQEQGELGEDFAVAEHFNVVAWFEETRSDLVAAGIEEEDWGEEEEDEDEESLDPETGCPLGEWPEVPQPINDFVILDQQSSHLALALVPTKQSWDVPIYLSFGGWNACPESGAIAGLLRYWHRNWEAELVVITFDTLELRVGQPPQDREAALKLAQEQYLVCQDIVDQGVENLSALAAGLLGGSAWFFWWD